MPTNSIVIHRGYTVSELTYLAHHGIKGMKWGVRRYQDESGHLTSEGKKKYSKRISRLQNKINSRVQKQANLEVGRKATTLRLFKDVKNHPERYNTTKREERAVKRHNKQIIRYDKAYDKQQKKIDKLLDKAKTLGVDRIAEPTILQGKAYFVDSGAYGNGYYMEQGTWYSMPVNSINIKLR